MTLSFKMHSLQSLLHILKSSPFYVILVCLIFKTGDHFSVLPVVAMALGLVGYLVEYFINKRWKNWEWTTDKWLYIAAIALYLYAFIWQIWSPSFTPRFEVVIGDRIPLLLCGIIGLLGLSQNVKLKYVAYTFILTSVITSLIIIGRAGFISFFALPWAEKTITFAIYRIATVNDHMGYNLYLNFSLVFSLYLLLNNTISKKIKIAVNIAALWLCFILYMSDGRVGQATSILLIVSISAILMIYYKKWIVGILTCILFGLIGYHAISQNNRVSTEDIEHDPRVYLWQSAWTTVQESPIIGHGVCEARKSFNNYAIQYEELKNGYLANIPEEKLYKKQPHNAYLEIWSEFGIIGLLTLLFLFAFPLLLLPAKNRIFTLLIIATCCIQLCFDTLFLVITYMLIIMCFTSQNEISQANVAEKQQVE